MLRTSLSCALLLFVVACAATSTTSTAPATMSMVPAANTREAVVAYVDQAAALVARSGPSCDVFKQPQWMSGDWYVFVVGPDNRLLCHANPAMVGQDNTTIVDANGARVGDMLVAAANAPEGHGWVDYVWPRPGGTTPVAKSSYAVHVTGPDGKAYVVGSGGYELK